jgi:ribosomal protein S24E
MAIKEIKVANEVQNKQLGRRELVLEVTNDGSTPSRAEIIDAVADRFNMKKADIMVIRVKQDYGEKRSSVLVHEYADGSAGKLAQAHIVARHEKKQKGDAAAEAKEPAKGAGAKEAAPKPAEKAEEKKEAGKGE